MKFNVTKEWLKEKLAEMETAGIEELPIMLPHEGGVIAKMTCRSMETTDFGNWKQNKVQLGAIYGNHGENKDFNDATPSGECWMVISEGRPAAKYFQPGKNYYVTFTPAND